MTTTERALAEIWSELLKVSSIGRSDNFMDLGGDSVTAYRCVNRVVESYSVMLPIDQLFSDEASLRHIAGLIDELRAEG
jgi:acyl carrier protein